MRYEPMLPPPGIALGQPVAPVFTGMALLESDAGGTYPRHQHAAYEVIIPLRLHYRCRLGGQNLAVGSHQALVVKPGDWHEDLLTPGGRHIGVWFSLGPMPLFSPGISPRQQIAAPPEELARRIVDRLIAEQRLGDGFAPRLQDALCLELFWLLVRALSDAALAPGFLAANRDATMRRRLDELFETHHRTGLGLDAMAEALHLSPRSLTTWCRRLTGLSPAKAFAAHRLGRARTLLRQTELSIKEVAAHLGYADQHHFSRAYKAAFGTSPSSRSRLP